MSEDQPMIAIDRETGMPFGYRDDSDAGLTAELGPSVWTIDLVKARAAELGKPFVPSPDIADRVEANLAGGALVLFTQDEVESAVIDGKIPKEWQNDLVKLVTKLNDIAVIPVGAVEDWREQQRRREFLLRKNC